MYSPKQREELFSRILERIGNGESLRAICADKGMPDRITVQRWLGEDPELASRYARAREVQADTLFEGMADIEDKVLTGDLRPDAARVILDSQRWRAEKLKPKAYGAKVDVNHGGEVNHSLSVSFVKAK